MRVMDLCKILDNIDALSPGAEISVVDFESMSVGSCVSVVGITLKQAGLVITDGKNGVVSIIGMGEGDDGLRPEDF